MGLFDSGPGRIMENAVEDTDPLAGFSAAILAGGESRRFGRNKAREVLGGKPLIAHVLDVLTGLFDDVLIVTNEPLLYESFDVSVVTDIVRGPGALGGLLTALLHARNHRCFITGCDMPFLNDAVVRMILERSHGYDVVVPKVKNEFQPLHALYSKKCIPFIQKGILKKDFRIIDFYPRVSVLCLEEEAWESMDPDNLSFFNVNTQDEFQKAKAWLAAARGDACRDREMREDEVERG